MKQSLCKHCKINTASEKQKKSHNERTGSAGATIMCRDIQIQVQQKSWNVFTDGSQMSTVNISLACGDVTRINTISQQVTSLAK